MRIILEIFTAYIVTAVLVNSAALYNFRVWFYLKTPWLIKGCPEQRVHLINCRMCVGFWVSLIISFCTADWVMFPLIYGASYFLATQER